jgi:hypothetical protein
MRFGILTMVALGGLCACGERYEYQPKYVPASETTPGQGVTELSREPVTEPNLATVTNERCDRELRCDHIGSARRWPTQEACVKDLKRSDEQAYGPSVCQSGVDRIKVSGCVQAIHETDCQTTLDTLDDLNACAPVKICRD